MVSNILVIQTAFIGDALLAVPLLKNLRKLYPKSSISLLCRKGLGEILSNTNLVNDIYEYDKSGSSALNKIKQELQKRNFDIIISPHESIRTHFLVRSLNSPIKVGFYKWWNGLFFNKRVRRPMHLPDALRQMSLLTQLNTEFSKQFNKLDGSRDFNNSTSKQSVDFRDQTPIPEWASMVVDEKFYSKKALDKVSKCLDGKGNFIAISPGSVWNTKKWTEEGFVQLAQKIQSNNIQVIFVGSPEETELCEKICSKAGGTNLAGQLSLYESTHVIKRAKLMVCNDSGGMHLAALVGTPIVSIFGPTVLPIGYRPWSSKSVVVQTDLDCRPCGLHGAKNCPIKTHACMENIVSDTVYEFVKKSLFN